MKKILWYSRHKPLEFQIPLLEKAMRDKITIDQMVGQESYISAEKLVEKFKNGGYHEMVMVAPLSVMAKAIELGVKPLKAEVEQLPTQEGSDFSYNGRHFKFLKFVRVTELRLITEDI